MPEQLLLERAKNGLSADRLMRGTMALRRSDCVLTHAEKVLGLRNV